MRNTLLWVSGGKECTTHTPFWISVLLISVLLIQGNTYIYIYIYPASFISLYALVNDKEEERRVKNIHQFTTNKNI